MTEPRPERPVWARLFSRDGLDAVRNVDPRWAWPAGAAVVLIVALVLVGRAFSVSCGSEPECVSLSELADGVELPEAIRLYDQDGELMSEVAGPLRTSLSSTEIPERVAAAFVAVEDRRFWEHSGVDAWGVARAAVRNLRQGDIEEGASTIPMQLVRTLWAESLRDVGPWRRKVIEARTAPRLIDELGHDRVLALYLNAIYLGNGIYGVERASQYYFGTGVDSLSLGQLATLVGMTRAPEVYDPVRYPDRALALRDVVLGTFVRAGVASEEDAEEAKAQELELGPEEARDLDRLRRRTHLSAAVMRELRRVAPEVVGLPGLQVHTTIDSQVQEEGAASLAAQLDAIDEGRYGAPAESVDSLEQLEGAAVALDPATGAVLAWIGGRDFGLSEFDRVEQARRQVGSLVKPLLVATALESGYGITDVVSADTVPLPTPEGPWLPADHIDEMELPLREALVRSSNRAAAHLADDVGLDNVVSMTQRGGVDERILAVPSISIGAFDASLLHMTAAYALFGNGGHRVEPYLISRVNGPDGSELWAHADTVAPEQVMDERTAFVVLDAMRAVVNRGTGYPVRSTGYWGPAAGKTGTTNDSRDAWFVGLTPSVVAGVWIGYDRPREIVRGRGGGELAAPAWSRWMRSLERTPRAIRGAWVPPDGVERVHYDVRTGRVVDLSCDARGGSEYDEAWVHTGRFEYGRCDRDRGWLRGIWRGITSFDLRPLGNRRGR